MNKNALDLSFLKQLSRGNESFELKLLKTFLEQTTLEMEKIKLAFLEKDWQALHNSAHKIKSSFHFIGELETEKILKTIEEICESENGLEQLPSLIDKFIGSCKRTLKNVKTEIEKYAV